MAAILFVLYLASSLFSVAVLIVLLRTPRLSDSIPPDSILEVWPRVSVIMPARNEATGVRAAVQSRLSDTYEDIELVAVNDRSTDATGALLDELAVEEPRLRVVHNAELPSGWLGKVHAMERGLEATTGSWLLLSDADVHVAPGTLRRALAWAEHRGLDHLGVLPRIWPKSPLFDAAIATFLRVVVGASALSPLGVGAFNLVRRSALQRAGGLSALRMEFADDVALARLIVQSGGRSGWLNGGGAVHLELHRSFSAMAQSAEKGAGAFGSRPLLVALLVGLFIVVDLAPFFAMFVSGWASAAALFGVVTSMAVARWMEHPLIGAILYPLGTLVGGGMILRGAVLAWARGGIRWRGTFHSFEEIRRAAAK